MSIEHLKQLRKALEDNKWIVVEELASNDYEISGYWKVARPNSASEFCLAFEVQDDMETLPIEKSYGCHIVGNKEVGLYFGKVSKSFPSELSNFIGALSSGST